MKKIVTTILSCFFLLPAMANAESLHYTNQQNHYSFTLPSGWVEIPKSTIDNLFRQLADQTGGRFIDYVVGFQHVNTSYFQYPYLLVQEHEINTPSYSQITQAFESDKFSENVDKEINKYSEFITNATLQSPFVDKERNIFFMNLEMDVANIGKVKGLLAMFLGKESITQLNFYSLKSNYSESLPTFNQIIDSFKYKQGYEYNEAEAKKNGSSSIFKGVIEKGVVGAITGGLIALIFGLFSKSRKKEE